MSALRDLGVPWVAAVLKILADGEWHSYQECLEDASTLIPTNEAREKGEYYRSYHYRRQGLPVKQRQVGSDVETIRTGRRVIMGKYLKVMENRRLVEIEYSEAGKRRRPERMKLGDVSGPWV